MQDTFGLLVKTVLSILETNDASIPACSTKNAIQVQLVELHSVCVCVCVCVL